jgi:hypothetical protein
MADYGAAVDEVTGLDARFPPAPAPWQQMWAEVRHRLGILRGWYSSGQGMNVTELTAVSVAFFVSCYHLVEHIRADPAVPQPARAQARRYANSKLQPQAGSRHHQHLQTQRAAPRRPDL